MSNCTFLLKKLFSSIVTPSSFIKEAIKMDIQGSLSGKNIVKRQQIILGTCAEKGRDEHQWPALGTAPMQSPAAEFVGDTIS